jgi:hypothetical protein
MPADRSELARCLVKVSEARGIAGHLPSNLTCSLVSAAGGAGVSTLTAAAGLALRRMTGKQHKRNKNETLRNVVKQLSL